MSILRARSRDVVAAVLLAAATVAVYAETRHFDFSDYDDRAYVTENEHVQRGLGLSTVAWAVRSTVASHWQPLTVLSHALDCQLFGLDAGAHHLTSVLLHVLNALLLFGLLRTLTGVGGRAAVVAALFALHPLHVESVAWIAERKDVLSTTFWLLTTWAYAGYARRPSGGRLLPVALLLATGLLAKSMLVTLPLTLLLLDHWPLRRSESWTRLIGEKLPLFALAALSSMVTLWAAGEKAMQALAHVPLTTRAANAVVSCAWYLGKTIWPTRLGVLYLHPAAPGARPLDAETVVLAAIVLLAISAWILWRPQPPRVVGWLWYLVTLAPVLGFAQAGIQARADRYTYVPLIGVFVLVVWTVGDWLESRRAHGVLWRRVVAAVTVVALGSYAVAARRQVEVWRNAETLYRNAIAVEPTNFLMHFNLGAVLEAEQRRQEAMAHYRRAIEHNPEYAAAHRALGSALGREGRSEDAIRHYREAVRLQPSDTAARQLLATELFEQGLLAEARVHYEGVLARDPDHAAALNNLGSVMMLQDDDTAAIAVFRRALAVDPNDAGVHQNLAGAFESTGREAEALGHRREAVRLLPESPYAHLGLAQALLATGDTAAGVAALMEVVRLAPDEAEPMRLAAWFLATGASTDADATRESLRLATRAVELTGDDDPRALNSLAAAQAAAGRFPEAIATARRALALAEASGEQDLVTDLRTLLGLYERGESYRTP